MSKIPVQRESQALLNYQEQRKVQDTLFLRTAQGKADS